MNPADDVKNKTAMGDDQVKDGVVENEIDNEKEVMVGDLPFNKEEKVEEREDNKEGLKMEGETTSEAVQDDIDGSLAAAGLPTAEVEDVDMGESNEFAEKPIPPKPVVEEFKPPSELPKEDGGDMSASDDVRGQEKQKETPSPAKTKSNGPKIIAGIAALALVIGGSVGLSSGLGNFSGDTRNRASTLEVPDSAIQQQLEKVEKLERVSVSNGSSYISGYICNFNGKVRSGTVNVFDLDNWTISETPVAAKKADGMNVSAYKAYVNPGRYLVYFQPDEVRFPRLYFTEYSFCEDGFECESHIPWMIVMGENDKAEGTNLCDPNPNKNFLPQELR
jgi:hypothetical protein